MRFNPPPDWPAPPPGWTPPAGWTPDPEWPKAPEGWQFYIEDQIPFPGHDEGAPSGSRNGAVGGSPAQLTTAISRRQWYRKKRFLIPVAGVVTLTLIGIFGPDPAPTVKVADAPTTAASKSVEMPSIH